MEKATLEELEAESKARPLPEAFEDRDGVEWTVHTVAPLPELARVDVENREMWVPRRNDPVSVAVRGQAMGRARFGHAELPDTWGVPQAYAEAAEQARINKLTVASGINLDGLGVPILDQADAIRLVASGNWQGIVLELAKSTATGRIENFVEQLQELLPDELYHQVEYLKDTLDRHWDSYIGRGQCDLEQTRSVASWLWSQAIGGAGKRWEDSFKDKEEGDSEDHDTGRGLKEIWDESEEDEFDDTWYKDAKNTKSDLKKVISNYGSAQSRYLDPGDMEIVYVPLDRSFTGRWARKRIPHEEGAIPRSMFRMPVDGRVFDYRVRKPGGTVLIDASGSMSLSMEDIEQVIAAAPGALVATYCGEGKHGELRIVAQSGRVANPHDLTSDMGGNIVDIPALEWLLREREPRIWVSDGIVTGKHDGTATNLFEDALRLCTIGRVILVPNVPTTVALLSRRAGLSAGDRAQMLERLKNH